MNEPIPLARPDLGEREEELVLEVLRSGRLSLGPRLSEFEDAFASWAGSDDAVAVSSGTAALHLGVRALGWGEGDEVLTTPLSFVASANCLLYERATPVFCDIDPVTLNIDPSAAQSAADNRRIAGILPVHIFGYPADLLALEGIADAYEIPILEDACQALGAIDAEGRPVGTAGHVAAFAFYANKQMTTGEGGVLVPLPAGEEMAEVLRSERNQGRSPDMARGRPRPDRLQLPDDRHPGGDRDRPARAARRDARGAGRCGRRVHGAARERPEERRRGRATPTAWYCLAPTAATSSAAGSSTSSSCPPAPIAAP